MRVSKVSLSPGGAGAAGGQSKPTFYYDAEESRDAEASPEEAVSYRWWRSIIYDGRDG